MPLLKKGLIITVELSAPNYNTAEKGWQNKMEKILSVSHISKSFDHNEVLHDISLDVCRGEVIAVIGPSGSGKSTLLRCINQLERVDSGSISVCGQTMVETDAAGRAIYQPKDVLQKIRLRVGLVFQSFNLFPHFSVLRNIMEAPVHVLGQTPQAAETTARDLLKKMGLSDKADAYPYQLSGGQQQRVSIARALALNPELLFFDEPTSALDPELTGEILKVLRQLAEEKMTMVIGTHEMAFARDVADRIIFMDHGNILEQGTPDEIFNGPRSERMQSFLAHFSDR